MSGVGRVAEETRRVHNVVEFVIAEAKSVHGEVERRGSLLAAQAEVRTAHIASVLSERVKEVAADSEVQASRVADVITQQLEKGLEAVATSAAVTLE